MPEPNIDWKKILVDSKTLRAELAKLQGDSKQAAVYLKDAVQLQEQIVRQAPNDESENSRLEALKASISDP